MFIPKRYLIRALKAAFFISSIFMLALLFMFAFAEKNKPDLQIWELISNWNQLIGFLSVFALVYPFIAFIKKDVQLIRTFSEERVQILNIFNVLGYEIVKEESGIVSFRLKNRLHALTRLIGEDMIDVDYNNPEFISVIGIRKDAYKIGRHIENLNRNDA